MDIIQFLKENKIIWALIYNVLIGQCHDQQNTQRKFLNVQIGSFLFERIEFFIDFEYSKIVDIVMVTTDHDFPRYLSQMKDIKKGGWGDGNFADSYQESTFLESVYFGISVVSYQDRYTVHLIPNDKVLDIIK